MQKRTALFLLLILTLMVGTLFHPYGTWADSTGYIRITTPTSGATWFTNSNQNVSWAGSGPNEGDLGPVDVTLWYNNNRLKTIMSNFSGASTSYKVPWNLVTKVVELRVTSKNHPGLEARQPVQIVSSSLTFTSLKGNNITLQAGSQQTLTWTYVGEPGPIKLVIAGDSLWDPYEIGTVTYTACSKTFTVPSLPATSEGRLFQVKTYRTDDNNYAIAVTSQFMIRPNSTSTPTGQTSAILTHGNIVFNTGSDNKGPGSMVLVTVSDKNTGKPVATAAIDAVEFKPNSSFPLPLTNITPNVKKNDCTNLKVMITFKANGSDTWSFNGRVTLYFSDGTQIVIGSTNQHIMHSSASNSVSVDLEAPAGDVGTPATSPPTPQGKKTGKVTIILAKCTNIKDPHYAMNYYDGGTPYPGTMNAKITSVKNTSKSTFRLWLKDGTGKLSPDVDFSPGTVSSAFNGMKLWGGQWGAAMGAPYPLNATLEVQWTE